MIKLFGAILVIAGCGGFGFFIAAEHRREEKALRHFISLLELMECELQYRLTALPELCRQAAFASQGSVKRIFWILAEELDNQISPDVEKCMIAALEKVRDMPKLTKGAMELLGRSLGQFDIEGQLRGLAAVRSECVRILDNYTKNQDIRLRSYQTLGLCAGAAIAILFI